MSRGWRLAAAVLLVVALIGAFWWRAAQEAGAVQDLIAQQKGQILQVQRTLTARSQLEKENRRLRKVLEESERTLLLPGDTPQAAASALQSAVTQKASELGIPVRNMRTLRPRSEGGYQPVRLSATLEADLESLVRLLSLLQEQDGAVFVSSVSIGAKNREEYQSLSVRLDLLGWSRPYTPAQAESKARRRHGG